MEGEGNVRRRVLWASALSLTLVATAYFVFLYQPAIVLDREKWDTVPYRQQAAKKMVASGQLLRLTEEQVRQQLGNPNQVLHASALVRPDSYTEYVWWYGLQSLHNRTSDTLNLRIYFDVNGRVIRTDVKDSGI